MNSLNRTKSQVKAIDFLEQVVSTKEMRVDRKHDFRKAIEDADLI